MTLNVPDLRRRAVRVVEGNPDRFYGIENARDVLALLDLAGKLKAALEEQMRYMGATDEDAMRQETSRHDAMAALAAAKEAGL